MTSIGCEMFHIFMKYQITEASNNRKMEVRGKFLPDQIDHESGKKLEFPVKKQQFLVE